MGYKYLTSQSIKFLTSYCEELKKEQWYIDNKDNISIVITTSIDERDVIKIIIFPTDNYTEVGRLKFNKLDSKEIPTFKESFVEFVKNTSSSYRPYFELSYELKKKDAPIGRFSKGNYKTNTSTKLYAYTGVTFHYINYSTVCIKKYKEVSGKDFKPFYNYESTGEVYDFLSKQIDFKQHCGEYVPPEPPGPTPEGGETDKSCSNAGQFGGGGKPLQDIKLSLFVNNVTKGNIKLSKPQLEVGTFATDWRPNPSDYIERNIPAYKGIKGMAIQHNRDQGKKYLEIQATDGTAYGVDIWGGDAKKLLEQQQKIIEELKARIEILEGK